MSRLAQRVLTPELMDNPGLPLADHHSALVGLQRLNAVSFTARYVWKTLERMATARGLKSFTVLDVATGGGDVMASLGRFAAGAGFDCRFTGWDISPTAVAFARHKYRKRKSLWFEARDALAASSGEQFDFVISTLFLHHLKKLHAIRLLKTMNGLAREGCIVDDLVRGRRGYWLAIAACHLLSASRIVRIDGPVSVRGAFNKAEVLQLAAAADLQNVKLASHWPRRFSLTWQK